MRTAECGLRKNDADQFACDQVGKLTRQNGYNTVESNSARDQIMNDQPESEAGRAIRKTMQGSAAAAWVRGIGGAVVGGLVGWFLYLVLLKYGFYALAIPGAFIGLGFGLLSGRAMFAGGLFCAFAGGVTMLFAEAIGRPFIADKSLGYFFSHLHELSPPTWIFMVFGVLMAFWFGRGR